MIQSGSQIEPMSDRNDESILTEPSPTSTNHSQAKDISTSLLIEQAVKRAIAQVGNQGRYQVLLGVYLSFCFITAYYFTIGNAYLFMNPSFQCNGQDVSEIDACKDLSRCVLKNDYTITGYVGLYCGEQTTKRDAVQSMLGLGAIFGVLFINFISDYKGRKFALGLTLTILTVSGITVIIGAYANSFGLFIFSQAIAGFASASMFTLIYVVADKLFSKRWSQLTIIVANATLALCEMSMLLFTQVLAWQHFSYVLLAGFSLVLLVCTPILIVQDPVLLFTKKNYDGCIESLKKIARINNKQSQVIAAKQIISDFQTQRSGLNQEEPQGNVIVRKIGYLKTLKNWSILKPIICFACFVFSTHLTSYLIGYCVNQIGYSYGVNTAIFGSIIIIGIIPLLKWGSTWPRRKSSIAFVIGMIVLSAVFVFKLPKYAQTLLVAGIKFLILQQYVIYIFFIVETFPQHVQSSCVGIVQTMGELGKFLSPLAVRLANDINISPLLVVTAVNLTFGLLSLIPLKETLKKRDKIEERSMISSN